jgi:hypothetical protein
MSSKSHKTLAKRYYNVARAVLKNRLVVFVAGKNDGRVNVWNTKKGSIEPISRTVASAICDTPLPWYLMCVVTCRRQDGQQYMKIEELAVPHPVTQSQIAKSCNSLHIELVRKCNPEHRLTAAWVGSPKGEELHPLLVDDILTNMGAYDFQAKWECE